MKINRAIRAAKVRLIGSDGKQFGVVDIAEALRQATYAGLDLVEISPNASPPVCKIIDYGKFRYQQTKRDRGQKKGQQQGKLKELKIKPNIDDHDFQVKLKKAREFVEKGNKVRLTCMFRGREMTRQERGREVIERFTLSIKDIAFREALVKMMGRNLSVVFAPVGKKQVQKSKQHAKDENKEGD